MMVISDNQSIPTAHNKRANRSQINKHEPSSPLNQHPAPGGNVTQSAAVPLKVLDARKTPNADTAKTNGQLSSSAANLQDPLMDSATDILHKRLRTLRKRLAKIEKTEEMLLEWQMTQQQPKRVHGNGNSKIAKGLISPQPQLQKLSDMENSLDNCPLNIDQIKAVQSKSSVIELIHELEGLSIHIAEYEKSMLPCVNIFKDSLDDDALLSVRKSSDRLNGPVSSSTVPLGIIENCADPRKRGNKEQEKIKTNIMDLIRIWLAMQRLDKVSLKSLAISDIESLRVVQVMLQSLGESEAGLDSGIEAFTAWFLGEEQPIVSANSIDEGHSALGEFPSSKLVLHLSHQVLLASPLDKKESRYMPKSSKEPIRGISANATAKVSSKAMGKTSQATFMIDATASDEVYKLDRTTSTNSNSLNLGSNPRSENIESLHNIESVPSVVPTITTGTSVINDSSSLTKKSTNILLPESPQNLDIGNQAKATYQVTRSVLENVEHRSSTTKNSSNVSPSVKSDLISKDSKSNPMPMASSSIATKSSAANLPPSGPTVTTPRTTSRLASTLRFEDQLQQLQSSMQQPQFLQKEKLLPKDSQSIRIPMSVPNSVTPSQPSGHLAQTSAVTFGRPGVSSIPLPSALGPATNSTTKASLSTNNVAASWLSGGPSLPVIDNSNHNHHINTIENKVGNRNGNPASNPNSVDTSSRLSPNSNIGNSAIVTMNKSVKSFAKVTSSIPVQLQSHQSLNRQQLSQSNLQAEPSSSNDSSTSINLIPSLHTDTAILSAGRVLPHLPSSSAVGNPQPSNSNDLVSESQSKPFNSDAIYVVSSDLPASSSRNITSNHRRRHSRQRQRNPPGATGTVSSRPHDQTQPTSLKHPKKVTSNLPASLSSLNTESLAMPFALSTANVPIKPSIPLDNANRSSKIIPTRTYANSAIQSVSRNDHPAEESPRVTSNNSLPSDLQTSQLPASQRQSRPLSSQSIPNPPLVRQESQPSLSTIVRSSTATAVSFTSDTSYKSEIHRISTKSMNKKRNMVNTDGLDLAHVSHPSLRRHRSSDVVDNQNQLLPLRQQSQLRSLPASVSKPSPPTSNPNPFPPLKTTGSHHSPSLRSTSTTIPNGSRRFSNRSVPSVLHSHS